MMLDNYFANSPTVGSHDSKPTIEELQARVQRLEERFDEFEKQQESQNKECEAKKDKFAWKSVFKKVKKFFADTVVPIINAASRFLNSISRFKGTKGSKAAY